ncbi:Hypothetical_protein [Hexamita inflata]|uniref:Hypothetical_protein n=1 Tax=Hexamita inflata TaxID=28002 RepID=A0AA86PX77_9EUKA|nr:Hypothetical protein HINF_LOCUS33053 [Hexamita inflata]CAI9945409.1 Hypothetical protein HINF_LOCUS33054 [Hexamita inflata]CAI9945411.1 Hypothetical protein HINF_LOCUS33056 [Hexamita inflata]CAI9945416.1 Hypothetical protein HINF_LOCUS33061 [Hexamita inflata]CAI9945417.1 Hypothetical protein HINF_LOCUS33062 [Hexamita inflata]
MSKIYIQSKLCYILHENTHYICWTDFNDRFQPRHFGIDGEPDFCFRKAAMLNMVTQCATYSSVFFGTEIEFGLQNGRSHRIQNCDIGSCFWRCLHHIPISREKGMIQ